MMNDMIADILKKAIPPEVMAMLTAEKMQEIGDRINATVTQWDERFTNIEQTQTRILELLENDSNGSGKRRAKLAAPVGDAPVTD